MELGGMFMVSVVSKVTEKKLNDILTKLDYEEHGLNEVVNEVIDLKDSEYYNNLYNACLHGKSLTESGTGYRERLYNGKIFQKRVYSKNPSTDHFESMNSKIIILGAKNFTTKPILGKNFQSLISMYFLLKCIYYMNIGRKLNREDVENLFLSKLDERIIFALNKFDESDNFKDPEGAYFVKLNNVNWEDKSTKLLFKNLNKLRTIIENDKFGYSYRFHNSQFDHHQDYFISFLAKCNATNHERNQLNKQDILIAYITFLKLIKTDITKYKAPRITNDKNIGLGYLVCDKCNEYYQLQPGESPDDFTDECECGGKLTYYNDLNEYENNLLTKKNVTG